MKLSNYVSLSEVTKSDTAKRRGISNEPTPEHLENLKTICTEVFDKVREHFGVPIYISSGYRSAALNKAIGVARTRTIILVGLLTWTKTIGVMGLPIWRCLSLSRTT